MTPTFTPDGSMAIPQTDALHLKSLLWGYPEGPRNYHELPANLRPAATAVDRIGDDLAEMRLMLYSETDDPANAILQANLLIAVLVKQVLPEDPNDVPDPQVVWTRSDLEGEAFDAHALDTAIHYWALGGEPNVFREGIKGIPPIRDIRAFQEIARAIVDASDVPGLQLSPTGLIEDFVRMHWSATGDVKDLDGWELHPLGAACFDAVRAARHLPVEEAELVSGRERPSGGLDFGRPWPPPAAGGPRW